MRPLALLLAALLIGSTVAAQERPTLELVIDGKTMGRFVAMDFGEADTGVTVTLREGRLESRFFQLWGKDLTASEPTEPGTYEIDPDRCPRRMVTLRQKLAAGLRSRSRSWTLLDACPSSWVIPGSHEESEKVPETTAGGQPTRELTIVARELAAAP